MTGRARAEEILRPHFPPVAWNLHREQAIDAMEQYAAEQCAERDAEIERLRERERRLVASGKYALDAISKYYFSDPDSTLDALDQLRAEVDQ